jgi:3'-5' exoribonuclease
MTTLISDMREGQKVNGIYLLRNRTLATTRAGKPFLTLTLGDRSGEIEGKVWDGAEAVARACARGDFIRVTGQVTEYNGKLQLTLQSVNTVDDAEINPEDFLPAAKRPPADMMAELMAAIQTVADPQLRKLLESMFKSPDLQSKFQRAPAAKGMHHAYLGGLLEHTLSLFHLCECVAPHFPEIDRDLLRAGALLHDVGKVDELSYSRTIDYTDSGRLMGHIVLEVERVSEAIRAIRGFPEEKAVLLKHLLVSHHGREEFGSPVKPMTLEALILHALDNLDAKVQAFRGLMEGEPSSHGWSAYHSVLGQYVFKGFAARPEPEAVDEASPPEDDKKDYPSLF